MSQAIPLENLVRSSPNIDIYKRSGLAIDLKYVFISTSLPAQLDLLSSNPLDS
jgi:hypothetical protein